MLYIIPVNQSNMFRSPPGIIIRDTCEMMMMTEQLSVALTFRIPLLVKKAKCSSEQQKQKMVWIMFTWFMTPCGLLDGYRQRPVLMADNLTTFMYRLSRNSESLNLLTP
jgi:hypothetical protein